MSTKLIECKHDGCNTALFVTGYCGPTIKGDPRLVELVIADGIDYLAYSLLKSQAIELAHSILEYYNET